MNLVNRIFAPIAVLLVAMICGCSSDTGTGESQDSDSAMVSQGEHDHGGGEHQHGGEEHGREGGEHDREGGEHDGEGRGEHDRDGDDHHGEEGEESGTEFALNETYDEVRHGARLILAYDAESNSFQGTVENTTDKTLERVRVEVHLSNGKELGPTTPGDLEPGEKREVKLPAESKDFDGWSAHPEVGSAEHGHGEGHGEHDGERGEHDREGRSEHKEEHKEGDSD